MGNLIQRQNGNLGLTENFYYDNLHRLDYSQLNGVTNLDMSYDALGNITHRTDVANNAAWQYDAAHKHQVLQAGSGNTYSYDQNGNVTARNGNSINWTSYNYPSQITGAGETISLYYDANRQRYKQVYSGNGNTETTLYIGGLMQKVSAGGIDDYRYTISAQGQTIAIMSRSSSGTNATRYMLNDYQGSVAKFTDSSGNSIVSESFTAFGARRNPQTWSGQPTYGDQTAIANIAREGYTGHTALGTLGLNHMNGRVQDAITGRFLSADPYITQPGNTQNYNRYSYVHNNPMSYTDPSGFCGYDSGGNCDNYGGCNDCLDVVVVTAPAYTDTNNGSVEYGQPGGGDYGGGGGGGGGDASAPLDEVVVAAKKLCNSALRTAGQNQAAVQRAQDNWSTLQAAASQYNIDPALLGAIGVRETGFMNIPQAGGGMGRGIFQIDLGAHPNVTEAQAFNLAWSANYAAQMLSHNMAVLGARFPNFTPSQLLQATAASYNLGVRGISGNPNTIDVGSAPSPRSPGNYGSNVVGLMQCF